MCCAVMLPETSAESKPGMCRRLGIFPCPPLLRVVINERFPTSSTPTYVPH